MGSPSAGGITSSPSMRMVGEPKNRSSPACSSVFTSRSSTAWGSSPSSRSTSCSCSRAAGWEGQPSHHRSSILMDLHPLDHLGLDRLVAAVCLCALDDVHRLHAGGHLAEHRVL